MQKKRIVFFSRCRLADLYGEIDSVLSKKYEIFHVAYDYSEFNILNKKYNIPPSKITIFKVFFKNYLLSNPKPDLNKLNIIDRIIIQATDERFNLNSSIQSDRAMAGMPYLDALRIIQACYSFWDEYLNKISPDIVFHELVSLSINHMCSVICKIKSIFYVSEIQIFGMHSYDLFFCTYWGGSPEYLKGTRKNATSEKIEENLSEINAYLDKFRNSVNTFLLSQRKGFRLIRTLNNAINVSISNFIHNKKGYELEDYIEKYIYSNNMPLNRAKNLIRYRFFPWDKYDASKQFYFYPMHLEPEGAVSYWGDGLYANQIKLIENIAGMLPPGVLLYVKDHPHEIGYRAVNDYYILKSIPNIRIIKADLPARRIILDSKGVITINGTAGFEALLLNKPVYIFGNAYYEFSNRVTKVKNIKDLRNILYRDSQLNFSDDIDLYQFIFLILKNSYEGNTTVYYGQKGEIDRNNIIKISNSFQSFIDSL